MILVIQRKQEFRFFDKNKTRKQNKYHDFYGRVVSGMEKV